MNTESTENVGATSGFTVHLLNDESKKLVGALELRTDPTEMALQIARLVTGLASDPVFAEAVRTAQTYGLLHRIQVEYLDGLICEEEGRSEGGLSLGPVSDAVVVDARGVLYSSKAPTPEELGQLF